MADLVSHEPKEDDSDPLVDAIVLRYTSIAGRLLAPGRHRIAKSHAKSLQSQGLARPPRKVIPAVAAVEADEESKTEED